jgi:hypothetical protein
MGVTPIGLAEYYPFLYHMAEADSWENISKHGLLSTSALLVLSELVNVMTSDGEGIQTIKTLRTRYAAVAPFLKSSLRVRS